MEALAHRPYGTSRGAVANYVNAFAVQSRAYTATFDSMCAAAFYDQPALIGAAADAIVNYFGPDL